MLRPLLISIITILISTPALAETIEFKAGGRLTFQPRGAAKLSVDLTLDADRFLTDRTNIDYCNLLEKGMRQCTDALAETEIRECEECAPVELSLFSGPGWLVMIVGGVAVLAGGVAIGIVVGTAKHRAAASP